jgi:hypothetical protein
VTVHRLLGLLMDLCQLRHAYQHRPMFGHSHTISEPHTSATARPTHPSFIFSACFLNFSANSISADLT